MTIIWQTEARTSFRQIAQYINKRFGRKARQEFLQKVKDTELLLKDQPGIGSLDPLFADRTNAYRSIIINGLSKMVYCTKGNAIHIVAFWDCRREPNRQAATAKQT